MKQTGSQTQNQTSTSTSSVGNSPDIQRFRDFQQERDPSRQYRYARQRQNVRDSFTNPYGSFTTPSIRDATVSAANLDLGQREGQEAQQENYGFNQQELLRRGELANLTAPRTTTGSGTSSGTTSQPFGTFVLENAIEGASAAATMGAGG